MNNSFNFKVQNKQIKFLHLQYISNNLFTKVTKQLASSWGLLNSHYSYRTNIYNITKIFSKTHHILTINSLQGRQQKKITHSSLHSFVINFSIVHEKFFTVIILFWFLFISSTTLSYWKWLTFLFNISEFSYWNVMTLQTYISIRCEYFYDNVMKREFLKVEWDIDKNLCNF